MNKRQGEFERTAMPHSRSLLRFALRLTENRANAEDIVQDSLLQAWRNFHQFQAGTNARAWLFRILINTFNQQARRTRIDTVPLNENAPPMHGNDKNHLEMLDAIDRLPVDHRTVLMLSVVEGFTCSEVSEILSIPIGTVMSRLSRARQSLRDQMAPACITQGTR